MKNKNLKKILDEGFTYQKRDVFNSKLEVYVKPAEYVIYDPTNDKITKVNELGYRYVGGNK